ncbi:MAG: TatD family hydrolase [Rikenellaceae bacterium]
MNRYYNVHTHNIDAPKDYRVDILSVRFDGDEVSVPAEGFFSVGIHPYDVEKWNGNEKWLVELEKVASHCRCVAIGECGIDMRMGNVEVQKQLFRGQGEIASKLELPLIIHAVRSEGEILGVLRAFDLVSVFHSYARNSVGLKSLERVYFSLSGRNVPYSDGVAIDQVLFESDEECASVVEDVYREFADRRDISVEELREVVEKNVFEVFKKMRH